VSAPFLRMEIHAAGRDHFKVVSKIDGAVYLERTVMAPSLPFYVESVVELAVKTKARRPARLIVESPEATRG